MSGAKEEARDFVRDNRAMVRDVLRFSQDTYARACALVLLKHGGTERDFRAIQEDLDQVRNEGNE